MAFVGSLRLAAPAWTPSLPAAETVVTVPAAWARIALAGRAKVGLRSSRTATTIWYLVSRMPETEHADGPRWSVSVRRPDGTGYDYAGTLAEGGELRATAKTVASAHVETASAAWRWAWAAVASGRVPPSLELLLGDRCCLCGGPFAGVSAKKGAKPKAGRLGHCRPCSDKSG